MNVLVIEPGHGSTWLTSAVFVDRFGKPNQRGRFVSGMPDDYRGQSISLTYPRKFILKIET